MNVPKASESGMLRRGSFTSPAVTVVVFHERAEVARETDGYGGDRAGLDHEKQRPAVEKSPERRERLAQIHVLAAGPRHHRGELAVRERADHCENPGQHPRAEQPAGTADV